MDIVNIGYQRGSQDAANLALLATSPAAFGGGAISAAYAVAETTATGIEIYQNGLDNGTALEIASIGASVAASKLRPLTSVVPDGMKVNKTLFSSNGLPGVEAASRELLDAVSRKRTISWATPGSDAERFLNMRGAEAASFGVEDIILRPNPSKAAVLEEFLHGTQHKLGIVDRLGTNGLGSAETHVKDFMIRHQRMLGLGAEDVRRIQILKDQGL